MSIKKYYSGALAALLITAGGCTEPHEQTARSSHPEVYAVNYPLAYFASRMATDSTDIVFPEMEGDPAFWEPEAGQVAAFQEADLILLNGADYAKWVSRASLPPSKTIDTSVVFKDRYIPLSGTVQHTHGPDGAHTHGNLAFTTWLDPELARQQAAVIYEALAEKDLAIAAGFEALEQDLAELNSALKGAFAPYRDQPLIGSHPVYQYLSRAYNLRMESVHWEPDAEPDGAQWRELEDLLETHPAKIMLWEDEPLESTRNRLAEAGIRCIVFNPCGNRPASGDYLTVMKSNLNNLQ
jgi:zinc transport system substrate-binding protein